MRNLVDASEESCLKDGISLPRSAPVARRAIKPPLNLAIIWFAVLCLMFVFAAPLAQLLFILFVPIAWSMLLAGGVIAIFALVTISRDFRCGGAVIALCLIGFALYFSNVGFELTDLNHVWREKAMV